MNRPTNAAGTLHACRVPGCTRARFTGTRSTLCKPHSKAKTLYGDVHARRIRPAEYATERREVASIFRRHAEHPAIAEGARALREIVDTAALRYRSAWRGSQVFRSDPWTETDPRELLAEACAVWLMAKRRGNALPDSERLTMMLGFAVARLVGRPARYVRRYGGRVHRQPRFIPAAIRRDIGRGIRDTLAPVLINACAAIEEREQRLRERRARLGLPLTRTARTPRDPLTGRFKSATTKEKATR